MSIRNLIFGVNRVTVSYLIQYDSLLQNVTGGITKCDSYFITKYDRSLLQNATFIMRQCDIYYKMRQFYHKMRQLLQTMAFITKCDVYYKM